MRVSASVAAVATPMLALDAGALRRNIERMAAEAEAIGTGLRPHVKAHKSADIVRLQADLGIVGVTCATTSEARLAAKAGAADVFVANQILDEGELMSVAALDCEATVAVDSLIGIARLEAAAVAAGSTLGVAIEVDVGMGRAGARSDDEIVVLTDAVAVSSWLTLRGVHGYEGHCMSIVDAHERVAAIRRANDRLAAAVRLVHQHFDSPLFVSGGGTGTYRVTGSHPDVTDVQVGSYALMDSFHERFVPGVFESACTVCATVISRHGNTGVLDAGRKAISTDFVPPIILTPGASVLSVAEEHMVCAFEEPPELGDRIFLVPSYVPTTVVLHSTFTVVEGGEVVDIWPVAPRVFHGCR